MRPLTTAAFLLETKFYFPLFLNIHMVTTTPIKISETKNSSVNIKIT